MESITELFNEFKELIDPAKVIAKYGLIVILAFVFAETGLFFGFFLPGDSLLLTAGVLANQTNPDTGNPILDVNIYLLIVLVITAAILGNTVGYYFGRYTGPKLFKKEDSRIFKKKYLDSTKDFYDRNGALALIMGRFLPIFRTFVPILAGTIQMSASKFFVYNVIGAVVWVTSFIVAGYALSEVVGDNLKYVIIALIIVTLLPALKTFLKERKRAKQKSV